MPNTFFYKSFTCFYIPKAVRLHSTDTFAPLFHQTDNTMRLLAFLLFFQGFFACQQNPEMDRLSAADIAISSVATNRKGADNKQPAAANVVLKSMDGGQTWQDVSAGLPKDLGIGSVLANGDEVFLGTSDGLYRSSTDSNRPTWQKEVLLWSGVSNLIPGKAGPYICSVGTGSFQELPGTGVWMPMHNTLKDKTVNTILETPDGTFFVGCNSGIYKSADGRKTWKKVFEGSMVTSLVAADGVLVAGGSKGLLRSTDGGEHWSPVLTEDGSIRNTDFVDGRFVCISNNGGPWKEVEADPEGKSSKMRASSDGGKTWQRMDADLSLERFKDDMSERLAMTRGIYDIKQAGQYLFCSLDAGIFRSSDHGKTWKLVRAATGTKRFLLTVSGQVLYAVMVNGGGC